MTLPRRLAKTALKEFAMAPPPFTLPLMSYDLVYHRRVEATARHQWFMDTLRSACENLPRDLNF